MFRPALVALAAAALSACEPTPQPAKPEQVYDVAVGVLSRDRQSAANYAGHVVRVRLEPDSYTAAAGEVRVWGTVPNTPPLVVFRCRGDAPEGVAVVVVGKCLGPTRDGIWRTAHADFCVVVTGCSVNPLP